MGFLGLNLGGNIGPDQYTSQLANLSQMQWQQANNGLYPAASQLVQYAENPDAISQARSQAITTADSSFATQQAGQQWMLALQGVKLTGAQSAAVSKQNALSKAMSEASAGNAAAATTFQNQQAALQGL